MWKRWGYDALLLYSMHYDHQHPRQPLNLLCSIGYDPPDNLILTEVHSKRLILSNHNSKALLNVAVLVRQMSGGVVAVTIHKLLLKRRGKDELLHIYPAHYEHQHLRHPLNLL